MVNQHTVHFTVPTFFTASLLDLPNRLLKWKPDQNRLILSVCMSVSFCDTSIDSPHIYILNSVPHSRLIVPPQTLLSPHEHILEHNYSTSIAPIPTHIYVHRTNPHLIGTTLRLSNNTSKTFWTLALNWRTNQLVSSLQSRIHLTCGSGC